MQDNKISNTTPLRFSNPGFNLRPTHLSSSGSIHSFSRTKLPLQQTAAEVKRRITSQFDKEKCETYFKLFAQFLVGDIPKPEFDKQLKSLLTEEQRKLHNLFILTVLRSAYGSLATTTSQRRSAKMVPYIPRLGIGARDITKQPIWQRIRSKMVCKANTLGIQVDPSAVCVVLMGLEHHIKSILCISRPGGQQRIMVSPILQHLAELENQEMLDITKKGDITASNITSALAIIPNPLKNKHIAFDDDLHDYHIHNNFVAMHMISGVPMNKCNTQRTNNYHSIPK